MSVTGRVFGVDVIWNGEQWLVADSGESLINPRNCTPQEFWARAYTPIRDGGCQLCGKKPKRNGHDPCLGHIKGAVAACCGHGEARGFVIYTNREAELLPLLEAAVV